MNIDITQTKTFCIFAVISIISGAVIGAMCNLLFYTVTHIRIGGGIGGTIAAKQIDPMWGIVFILIMATTAFCIALTFRLVPGWVARYYESREMPPIFKWLRNTYSAIEQFLEEKKE